MMSACEPKAVRPIQFIPMEDHERVTDLQFANDGEVLRAVVAYFDAMTNRTAYEVRSYDPATGELLSQRKLPLEVNWEVSLSPDGTQILTIHRDLGSPTTKLAFQLRDFVTGAITKDFGMTPYQESSNSTTEIGFLRNGHFLWMSHYDSPFAVGERSLAFWDINTGKMAWESSSKEQIFGWSSSPVDSQAWLVTGISQDAVNLNTGTRIPAIPRPEVQKDEQGDSLIVATFTPDGKKVLSETTQVIHGFHTLTQFTMWDLEKKSLDWDVYVPYTDIVAANDVNPSKPVFLPDGSRFLVASDLYPDSVKAYDSMTGQFLFAFTTSRVGNPYSHPVYHRELSLSQAGDRAGVASWNSPIGVVWDTQTGNDLYHLVGRESGVEFERILVSADGTLAAGLDTANLGRFAYPDVTYSYPTGIRIWDIVGN